MVTRIITSIIVGIVLAGAAIIPLQAHNRYSYILASPTHIINKKDTGIVLLDRNGRSFFHFYEAKSKRRISLEEIPLFTRQAVIAVEDQSFYSHIGVSPRGILRSLVTNIRAGEIVYGGSTITQQVIKNSLLTTEKSWLRKYQEATLALELETKYSKDQILEMYFNSAYFGEGAFGIEEAAQTYFAKPAKELTLAESSLLAGLLTSPSVLSPISHDSTKAFERQRIVLQNMVELGFITLPQKNQAVIEHIAFNPEPIARNGQAPHFALFVRDQLAKEFGEDVLARSGLTITTSLDLDIQAKAEAALQSQLKQLAAKGARNGAVVIMDPTTHEVLAMVGSNGWFEEPYGKMNMATSPRQPGSSFKPIVYASGFDAKLITPASVLLDIPKTFGKDYRPADYDGRYRGPVLVRRALANSLNIPAVEVMQKVGVKQVAAIAKELGITTLGEPHHQNLALALGAGEVSLLEMTNVYATFADQGEFLPAQVVLNITTKSGAPYELKTPHKKQVLSSETAFLISSILSDEAARAEIFGKSLTISRPAAVKTGTSQSYKDAWTIGYTPQLTIGVWIGNNDNKPMQALAGALGAAPVFKQLMEEILQGTAVATFSPPPNITLTQICRRTEYFIAGTERAMRCPTPSPSPSVAPTPIEITQHKPALIP